jgi:hypothetical protein
LSIHRHHSGPHLWCSLVDAVGTESRQLGCVERARCRSRTAVPGPGAGGAFFCADQAASRGRRDFPEEGLRDGSTKTKGEEAHACRLPGLYPEGRQRWQSGLSRVRGIPTDVDNALSRQLSDYQVDADRGVVRIEGAPVASAAGSTPLLPPWERGLPHGAGRSVPVAEKLCRGGPVPPPPARSIPPESLHPLVKVR